MSARVHPGETPASRRGMVLVIVLVVIAVLALGAYAFAELMVTQRAAARMSGRQLQARALADSGVDALRVLLAKSRDERGASGGVYNNTQQFQGITVINDPDAMERGKFTVLAPNLDQNDQLAGIRYGLEDESARLNLNLLLVADKKMEGTGRTLLKGLPGMTDETADAILDFMDEDEEPREYGCEAEYYSGLTPPYSPANRPLVTVEELLLVRGVTPELLFGYDVNRNGMIDPQEMPPGGAGSNDVSTQLGWSPFLTLSSKESNVNGADEPRININQDDLQALYQQLTERLGNDAWASYIVAYRQFGPASSMGRATTWPGLEIDFNRAGNTKFGQVLDLIGSQVQVQGGQGGNQLFSSPFSSDLLAMGTYLPVLLDNLSASDTPVLPGRLNVNQAPKTLLQAVPGMTEEILNEILSRRTPEPDVNQPLRRHEAWLLAEGIVTLQEMKSLTPFLCGGGDVYRAQVVGYFQGGQAASRAEVVLDATESPTRVLLWRDLSHLGRGYALETLGVDLNGGTTSVGP
ncbi:MAG: type II secretion system protein GspK [Pirellulales bacterium]